MKETRCAYCGIVIDNYQKEHAIPKCLYPYSKAKSKVQRITIPSCHTCNNGFSDDEVHFRNILLIAGEPNDAVKELWETTMHRSFYQVDGQKRAHDLFLQMKPIQITGNNRYMIYPGKDQRVIRVIRKIVRGLAFYHNILTPISEKRIWVDVMQYTVPQEYLKMMMYQHREKDICEYRFHVLQENDIHSVWIITFFERCTFVALISMSENGFPEKYD